MLPSNIVPHAPLPSAFDLHPHQPPRHSHSRMMETLSSLRQTLPKCITLHHIELHIRSVREVRPIIEFEYSDDDDCQVILSIFAPERPALLADLTDYLKSTCLHVRNASIFSLPSASVIDQFTLYDPHHILQHDDTLHRLHDALISLIRQSPPPTSTPPTLPLPSPLLTPTTTTTTTTPRHKVHRPVPPCPRISSNIALRELEEEHLLEYEASRRQSEALTANFVEHAIASLVNGEYLYHFSASSYSRYRSRFFLSEDRSHLCWGDANAVRLSRYAGCLFGPSSQVFSDMRSSLVDKAYLCFSLIPLATHPTARTVDLVCVSVDQLNRWFLGLQSCCALVPSSIQRLTLDDIARLRVIFKIRAQAHARGLTVRRFILKRVVEAGLKRNSVNLHSQYTHEIHHLEAELARLQKSLIECARRETLLNTSLRDFQTSWAVDPANIELLHPIGRGAFSEMWKGLFSPSFLYSFFITLPTHHRPVTYTTLFFSSPHSPN